MKVNKSFKGPDNLLTDYKNILIRQEWLARIIDTYFDKYDLTENYELNQEAFYITAKYKKEKYNIYYRKEITMENGNEIIKYRIINCIATSEVIKMSLSIGG